MSDSQIGRRGTGSTVLSRGFRKPEKIRDQNSVDPHAAEVRNGNGDFGQIDVAEHGSREIYVSERGALQGHIDEARVRQVCIREAGLAEVRLVYLKSLLDTLDFHRYPNRMLPA